MNWKKWEDSGALRRLETGPEQATRLLQAAQRQLAETGKIFEVGVFPATRDEAYGAMLKAGMALILANGYRPESGSHHVTTVRVVSELLGHKRRGLAKAFNDLRRRRHERLYDGIDFCTRDEAERAIHRATELVEFVGDALSHG